MKKITKVLLPGALAFAFIAAPVATTPVLAQDAAAAATPNPEREKLENDFRGSYKTNPEGAYQTAKEYLQKFSTDKDATDFVKYLQGWVTKYEAKVKAAADEALYTACSGPYAAKPMKADAVFTGCKALIAAKPDDSLYALLIMADAGYQQNKSKVTTYNDQALNAAKQAIQLIESGKTPSTGKFYPFTDKNQALAWMNYTVGFINFNKDLEPEGAPYFYKAVQMDAEIKKNHFPYYAIAFAYQKQYNQLVAEWKKIADTLKEPTDETKRLEAEYNAVADRAIDAYARAYKAASAANNDTAKATYLKTLSDFYKARHGQAIDINTVVASVDAKPLPDPSVKPDPVMPTPATTTTGAAPSGTTGSTTTPASTTTTSSSSTTAAKPAATTAKPAATAAPAANTNGTAKTSQKPAAKTNGTRPQR